jgi:hypothetical protein
MKTLLTLLTALLLAQPDCITLPQYFKANGYHTADKGLEDGRSWSEPHWYSSGNAVDKERLKDQVGSNRRFAFALPRTDNATATRPSAKTTLAKPDRRSVGETEVHYLWLQLFHSALNEERKRKCVERDTRVYAQA